jgi:hypothetical protein
LALRSGTPSANANPSTATPQTLNEQQLDFTLGYLNKHHRDVLAAFAETFSRLGQVKSQKNSWSGGSYNIEAAKIVHIDTETMELEVSVKERNKDVQLEKVSVELGMPGENRRKVDDYQKDAANIVFSFSSFRRCHAYDNRPYLW